MPYSTFLEVIDNSVKCLRSPQNFKGVPSHQHCQFKKNKINLTSHLSINYFSMKIMTKQLSFKKIKITLRRYQIIIMKISNNNTITTLINDVT